MAKAVRHDSEQLEQLRDIFRRFDMDSDMMRDADTNGDGVLSFNEFANIMAKSAADFPGLPPGTD